MSEATTAQAQTTALNHAVNVCYERLYTLGVADIADLDTWRDNYNGDAFGAMGGRYASARNGNISGINVVRSLLTFSLGELGASDDINNPFPFNTQDWWRFIEDYYNDEGSFSAGSVDSRVTARGWTRGAEPTLTGFSVARLNVTPRGNSLETGVGQDIKLSTVSGPGSDLKVVRFQGEDTGIDVFDERGSGLAVDVASVDELNPNGQILANPIFDNSVADDQDIASITGWALSTATDFQAETGTTFRTLTRSIKTAIDGATLTQTLSTALEVNRPYVPVVIARRSGGTTGDGVTIDWGSHSQAFTSISTGSWDVLLGDRDSDLYPLNFDDATDGRTFKLTFETSGGGTIIVAAAFWVPMFVFNGTFWAVIGDETIAVADTHATVTDSVTDAGKINSILSRFYGAGDSNPFAALPTTGTNLIADPS